MQKIKIAQIGVGHDHASFIFESLLKQSDFFEVVGYCVCEDEETMYRLHKERLYSRSVEMTLEELLNYPGLQAVTVECNEEYLTKYAKMAVDHQLSVHMDKPGSENHEKFEDMLLEAQEKGLEFHLGYMYRYNPAVQRTMEMIKKGTLGQIYSVEAQMNCLHNPEKRQWLGRFQGGMMFYLGCHLIDLIVQIQGIPKKIVPYNKCTGYDGVTAKDFGMAVLEYDQGVSFAKTSAVEPGGFVRRQLVICGEKGTIEINPLERYIRHSENGRDMVTVMREMYQEEAVQNGWNYSFDERTYEPFNRYDDMMRAFADMVRGEKKNPYTTEYEILLHKLLLQACGYEKEPE